MFNFNSQFFLNSFLLMSLIGIYQDKLNTVYSRYFMYIIYSIVNVLICFFMPYCLFISVVHEYILIYQLVTPDYYCACVVSILSCVS